MKKHLVWLLTAPLLSACDVDIGGLGGCRYEENFSDAITATSMSTLRVLANDGDLRIEGRPGLTQVRVFATACASSSRTVDDIDFVLYRNGSTVELETDVPFRDDAHLDLLIEVPEEMAAVLYHEAGDLHVRDIDYVYLEDNAGNIEIRNIYFDVEVIDESGHIDIVDVGGSVEIDDGSGDIDVADVGGDLIVWYDGGGSLRYRNVFGHVQTP